MATFLQGSTDQFGPQHLYQPDYGFLTQVMGQQQGKYDQGFSQVKSLYSSLLNSPVTNGENEQWRADMFRKLETQMRSISQVDLSQSSNVMKARSLFDPLLNDQELQADMRNTQLGTQELGKLDQLMNSPDPEVRKTYSEDSRRDVQFGLSDLKAAKRGDGSILRAQVQKMTQVEDVGEFLAKAAKEEGLEVKQDAVRGPYLVSLKNGAEAATVFSKWAEQRMGTRFDRQLNMQARVKVETGVRSLMAQGLSRGDALGQYTQKLQPELLGYHDAQLKKTDADLDDLTCQINQLQAEADVAGGVPQEKAAQYTALLQHRQELERQKSNQLQDVKSLSSPEAQQFLSLNLNSQMALALKQQQATKWGTMHAIATGQEEVRPNQVWITKFIQGQENMRQGRQLSFQTWEKKNEFARTDARLSFDQAKYGQDFQEGQRRFDANYGLADRKQQLDELEVGYKYEGGYFTKTATGSKGKDGKGTTIELNGVYTPEQHRAGVDVVLDKLHAEQATMVDNAFNNKDAMLGFFYPGGNQKVALLQAVGKLTQMSQGSSVSFTDSDKAALDEFHKRFPKVPVTVPQNQGVATEVLQRMALGIAERLPAVQKAGVGTYSHQQNISLEKSVAAHMRYVKTQNALEDQLARVGQAVLGEDGQPKQGYEQAKFMGVDRKGRPMYDVSALPAGTRQQLDPAINQQYLNQTGVSGSSYTITNPKASLLHTMFNPNTAVQVIGPGGEDITAKFAQGKAEFASLLASMPTETQNKSIGSEVVMNVDPVSQQTRFVIKSDPDSPLAKGKGALVKPGQQVTFVVPNNRIAQHPELQALAQKISDNTPRYSDLAEVSGLSDGKPGRVSSASKAAGFDASWGEIYTGTGPEVHIELELDVPGSESKRRESYTIAGSLSDPQVRLKADQYLNTTRASYINLRTAHDNAQRAKAVKIPLSQFKH